MLFRYPADGGNPRLWDWGVERDAWGDRIAFGPGDPQGWAMRPVVLLILGAVFACDMIYALVTGWLPRQGTFVRNPEGGKEWTRIYRSELPWLYWGGVISRGLAACLLFVFTCVR